MRKRTRFLISSLALIPLTLMADSIISGKEAKIVDQAEEKEEFRMVELVPNDSAGFANSFHTFPVLPY